MVLDRSLPPANLKTVSFPFCPHHHRKPFSWLKTPPDDTGNYDPAWCGMTRFISLAVMLFFLVGCGGGKGAPAGTVSGKITYKGQPVNGAALQLTQTAGQGDTINIPVTQEGTFSVADVPAGDYIVVVVPSSGASPVHIPKNTDPAKLAEAKAKVEATKTPPTIPIPEKYKQRLTSGLNITIAAGQQTKDIELKD